MDYEAIDTAALHSALLALKVCPHCRDDLHPIAYHGETWGCPGLNPLKRHGFETWYIPEEENSSPRIR